MLIPSETPATPQTLRAHSNRFARGEEDTDALPRALPRALPLTLTLTLTRTVPIRRVFVLSLRCGRRVVYGNMSSLIEKTASTSKTMPKVL